MLDAVVRTPPLTFVWPGAIVCQVIDSIYPGTIPLDRVNFAAQYVYEFEGNFRLFLAALHRHRLKRVIDVQAIVRGRTQEILHLAQWLRHLWQTMYNAHTSYDAEARRASAARKWEARYRARSKRLAGQGGFVASPKPLEKQRREPSQSEESLAAVIAERDAIEVERDWYYDKLRQIEVACDDYADDLIPRQLILDLMREDKPGSRP